MAKYRLHISFLIVKTDSVEISSDDDGISTLTWSPDGSQIAIGTSGGKIQVSHIIKGFVL